MHDLHAALNAANAGAFLVLAEIMPGLRSKQRRDLGEVLAYLVAERVRSAFARELRGVARVIEDARRHLLDRQDEIDDAGGGLRVRRSRRP